MTIIFLIIGIIVTGIVIVKLYAKSWSDNLSAEVSFHEEAVDEGKKGTIIERITNTGKFSVPIATIKFELDKSINYVENSNISVSDRQYRCDAVSIGARRSYTRKFEVKYTKRGVYSIGNPVLSTKDIFGKYNYTSKFEGNSEIYVYPSYSRYTEIMAPFSLMIGEAVRNRFLYEDPFEFKGIRDYTGTEPMKKINWSASAKTGSLKVNNYYDTSSRHATIFLDIANSQIWKRLDQLEECIRIARNYMEGFIKNHIPLEIVTNGRDYLDGDTIEFETGNNAAYVIRSLRKMARIGLDLQTERLDKYMNENVADSDELCILISVDQSENMINGFEHYLQKNNGEWICPIVASDERLIRRRQIHVTYVEVGR